MSTVEDGGTVASMRSYVAKCKAHWEESMAEFNRAAGQMTIAGADLLAATRMLQNEIEARLVEAEKYGPMAESKR